MLNQAMLACTDLKSVNPNLLKLFKHPVIGAFIIRIGPKAQYT